MTNFFGRKANVPPSFFILSFFLLVVFIRFLYIASLTEQEIVSFVPDDSFYYLQLAKNYTKIGLWTFDGINPSTGFHKLYAYTLVLASMTIGHSDFKTLFIILSLFNILLLSISINLIVRSGNTVFPGGGWFAALPFFSLPILYSTTFIMETSLVILIYSAMFYFFILSFYKESGHEYSKYPLLTLAVLGPWARTDFGLFVFLLSLFILVSSIRSGNSKKTIILWVATFLLTSISTILTIAHNFLISGKLFQSSALIKSYWSELAGNSIVPAIIRIVDLLLPATPLFGLKVYVPLILISFMVLAVYSNKLIKEFYGNVSTDDRKASILFLLAVVCLLGYSMFYSRNSAALQTWYSASFLIPVCIIYIFIFPVAKKHFSFRVAAFLPVLASICLSIKAVAPWQSDVYFVTKHVVPKLEGKLSAWNSGIYGYFSNGRFTNIDGLVNDNVIPYIISGDLMLYLDKEEVAYVIDHEAMLSGSKYRRSGLNGNDKSRFKKIKEYVSNSKGYKISFWKIVM